MIPSNVKQILTGGQSITIGAYPRSTKENLYGEAGFCGNTPLVHIYAQNPNSPLGDGSLFPFDKDIDTTLHELGHVLANELNLNTDPSISSAISDDEANMLLGNNPDYDNTKAINGDPPISNSDIIADVLSAMWQVPNNLNVGQINFGDVAASKMLTDYSKTAEAIQNKITQAVNSGQKFPYIWTPKIS
jgi:hypothetical protein